MFKPLFLAHGEMVFGLFHSPYRATLLPIMYNESNQGFMSVDWIKNSD